MTTSETEPSFSTEEDFCRFIVLLDFGVLFIMIPPFAGLVTPLSLAEILSSISFYSRRVIDGICERFNCKFMLSRLMARSSGPI